MQTFQSVPNLSRSQRIGAQGEQIVFALLAAKGYRIRPVADFFDRYDCLLTCPVTGQTVEVEIKTAKPSYQDNGKGVVRTRWLFDNSRSKHQVSEHSLIVLLLEDETGDFWPYFVPRWELTDRPANVSITSHPTRFRGWLADRLEAWQVIPFILKQRARYSQAIQLPLLAQGGLSNDFS